MIKTFLSAFVFLCMTSLFGQKNTSFEIRGTVENNYTGIVFLYHYDEKNKLVGDKGYIKDHQFYFKSKIAKSQRGYFVLGGHSAMADIYLETGSIKVLARVDSVRSGDRILAHLTLTKITGSKSQAIWDDMMAFSDQHKSPGIRDPFVQKLFFNKVDLLSKKYPDMDVVGDIVVYVKEDLLYGQLKTLYTNLSKKQRERLDSYGIQKSFNRLQQLALNEPVYFPTQTDTAGKKITLADLHYTYLLIDFWSATCAPCREAHPGMIALYNSYKAQGFNVIGISLDNDRTAWMRAMHQDKLPWTQVSDLKDFSTDIVEHYSIGYIPFNILIDNKGKIIATELRGEDLDKTISELFRK